MQDKNKSLQKILLNLDKQFSNLRPYLTNEGFKKHIEDLIQKSKASNYGLSYNLPYIRRHSNEQNELYITEPDRVTQKMTYLPDKISNSILPYYETINPETKETGIIAATKYKIAPPQQITSSIKISNPVTGNSEFYIQGMTYKGKDNFIILVVDLLNKINSVQKGKTVVQALLNSINLINIQNNHPTDNNGNPYVDSQGYHMEALLAHILPNGGGDIDAASLMRKLDSSIEEISHELFHFYQKEKGQNPKTVNGEVGAYLYGKGIESLLKKVDFRVWGNSKTNGTLYIIAMDNLFENGFNKKDYQDALMYFKTGSRGNTVNPVTGKQPYGKHKIDNSYICLIKNFLPF